MQVCASNQNRSLEAHALLAARHFDVRLSSSQKSTAQLSSDTRTQVHSSGTSSSVKLPGASADAPHVYSFQTLYEHMYADLQRQDASLYTRNGILAMLERNMRVKPAPERWQDCRCACCTQAAGSSHPVAEACRCRLVFDCAVTFEERCLHALISGTASLLPVRRWALSLG